MTTRTPLLQVENLTTVFPSGAGPVRAVDGVSLTVNPGERVGIVGESGSGKSVTALTIMGLIDAPPASLGGRVLFQGDDLLQKTEHQLERVRGAHLGIVFQNPLSCLNPAMTIGDQIREAIAAHQRLSASAARRRVLELLHRVGIPSPERSADEYPHRFSGGMRQRVMIAMALSCEPDLLIADEPTTALDVTIQAQILELLFSVSEEMGTAVVLITHDLGILAGFAERIVVMYAGRVVEEGPIDTLYYGPTHPYTWGLMTSVTRVDDPRSRRLSAIPGTPPSAVLVPPGCAFHPRCPYAQDVCIRDVPRLEIHRGDSHPSACHFAGSLQPPATLQQAGSG